MNKIVSNYSESTKPDSFLEYEYLHCISFEECVVYNPFYSDYGQLLRIFEVYDPLLSLCLFLVIILYRLYI